MSNRRSNVSLRLGLLLCAVFSTGSVRADLVVAPGENVSLPAGKFAAGITNNGTIYAPGEGLPLTLTGQVDGAGRYVGNLAFNGQFSPGNSPAVVRFLGNLTFGAGNTLFEELAGTALGEFDRLEVSGNVTLAGALVVELISPFTLSPGQSFEIIDVGGTRSGQFDGLNEGDIAGSFGGVDLFISYAAGDGNNVSLYTAVPESAWIGTVGVALASLCGWWTSRAAKRRTRRGRSPNREAVADQSPGFDLSSAKVVPWVRK